MPGTPVKNATKAIKVFCSYAHADEEWRQKLEMHLSLLIHEGTIELWYDRKIRPGTDWAREIDDHLNGAELILLLISSKFMNSYYCQGIEMKRALERHHAGIAYVVPILISSCDWETAPFAQLQVLPGGKFITEWSERDENAAFALVVKGLRQLIDSNLRLGPDGSLRKPAQHGSDKRAGQNNIPESQTQDNSQHLQARDNSQQQSWPLVWNVPFARNPFFTGREELLAQVSTQLRSSPGVALGQMQAISGLGGIGKTQLAIEYAYRQRQYYQAILWARADALDTLNASYSELATLLDLPQKNAEKQEIVVQAVKSWLETQRNWLLILDNLDEPGVLFPSIHNGQPRVLSPFLPDIPGGHLLITTRATDLASLGLGLAHPLPVETLSPQQGASLLLQRANLLTSSNTWETATSHGSKPVTSYDLQCAEELSEELGGLPLALDQAGAYLAATGTSLTRYLFLFRQRSADLLAQRRSTEHPESVATTWSLSFERIEEKDPAAAELLRFCAFLAPDAIPEELLTEGAEHLGALLKPVVTRPLQFDAAIEALRAYSLITRDPQAHTLTVHRLVQAIQRDNLDAEAQREWMQRAILATSTAFPRVASPNWSICERLLPHALLCVRWAEQPQVATPLAASLINETGIYLDARGRYAEAEALYLQALAMRTQLLGEQHPGVAESLNYLAGAYKQQSKYAEAEPLYLRALAIREKRLGPEHPYTAITLNNLASLYDQQERYAKAEGLLRRALAIDEKVYGREHPAVATNLNNLAAVCQNQKRYAEAGQLYRRALVIREQHLGLHDPHTANSLNNLASLAESQNQLARAEELYLRALQINEKFYGPDHPEVAINLNNLAGLYTQLGKIEKAEQFFQRALAINEQKLGSQHASTANSLYGLARLRAQQKKYAEAKEHYERAIAIYTQALGENHRNTQQVRADYTRLLRKMGQGEKAGSRGRKWGLWSGK